MRVGKKELFIRVEIRYVARVRVVEVRRYLSDARHPIKPWILASIFSINLYSMLFFYIFFFIRDNELEYMSFS